MNKYLFLYQGGAEPKDGDNMEATKQEWMQWFDSIKDSIIDGGGPLGITSTANSNNSTTQVGGPDGYSIISADNLADACKIAHSSPSVVAGGNIAVSEIMKMPC